MSAQANCSVNVMDTKLSRYSECALSQRTELDCEALRSQMVKACQIRWWLFLQRGIRLNPAEGYIFFIKYSQVCRQNKHCFKKCVYPNTGIHEK